MTIPNPALVAVQRERQQLGKQYRAAVRAAMTRQLDCPAGTRLTALLKWSRKLRLDQGRLLVRTVAGQPWLLAADAELRHTALRLLSRQIVQKRERVGLVPFDDPLPGAADNVFLRLKKILRID